MSLLEMSYSLMAKCSDSYIYLGLPLYQSSPAAIERSIYFAIGRSLLVVNSKIERSGPSWTAVEPKRLNMAM